MSKYSHTPSLVSNIQHSVVRWKYVQLQSKLAGAKDPLEVLTQSKIVSQSPRKEGAKTEWLEVALDCEK